MPDHFDRIAEVHERSEQAISHSEALAQGDDERTQRPRRADDLDPNPYDEESQRAEWARQRIEIQEQAMRRMERSAAIAKDIWNMGVDAMKGQRGY